MKCPFCHKRKGCAHRLLIYDRTFHSIEGGSLFQEAEALQDALSDLIDHYALTHGKLSRSLKIPAKKGLRELVRSMHERVRKAAPNTPPEDLSVRTEAANDFAELLFISMIGDDLRVYMDDHDNEGGPGMSSEELYFHAKDPEAVRQDLITWTMALRAATPTTLQGLLF